MMYLALIVNETIQPHKLAPFLAVLFLALGWCLSYLDYMY